MLSNYAISYNTIELFTHKIEAINVSELRSYKAHLNKQILMKSKSIFLILASIKE